MEGRASGMNGRTRFLGEWLADAAGTDVPIATTSWLFVRAVGVVSAVAWISLAVQIPGIFGEHGILRVGKLLAQLKEAGKGELFWQIPSVFWLDASDGVLLACGWGGVLLSLLVVFDRGTRWLLPILWALYLSFVNLGEPFFPYQWDALLLETYAVAWLVALPRQPSLVFLWLARWLAFRLMLLNGLVKALAVDPAYGDGNTSTWRDGTALAYHYFTQPIPGPVAWWFHHFPSWAHAWATYGTLAIELVFPFAVFLGRWPRLIAFAGFCLVHAGILITGTHAFYNWLSLAIFIALLDDRFLGRFCRTGEAVPADRPAAVFSGWQAAVAGLFVACSVAASLPWVFRKPGMLPAGLLAFNQSLAPWHITSGYGAFAHMTRTRPEIVIEGSADGITWREYALPFKPGDPSRRPAYAAPHHPRLDWQLWFAALGQPSPWLGSVYDGLLHNSPAVLSLFASNPFPDSPPRYVRSLLYDYRFTDPGEDPGGAWWKRRFIDAYGPVVTLGEDGRPRADRP